MITIEILTHFIGWCAALNTGILLVSSLVLVAFKKPLATWQSQLFGISSTDLLLLYTHYLSQYKIAVLVFNIVPYCALKIIA